MELQTTDPADQLQQLITEVAVVEQLSTEIPTIMAQVIMPEITENLLVTVLT